MPSKPWGCRSKTLTPTRRSPRAVFTPRAHEANLVDSYLEKAEKQASEAWFPMRFPQPTPTAC